MSYHTEHDSVGPLDVVVSAVLANIHAQVRSQVERPLHWTHATLTLNEVAEQNAHTFLNHFDGRPILAIKAIREVVPSFSLAGAKRAFEQIRKTYSLPVSSWEELRDDAIEALEEGRLTTGARLAEEARDALHRVTTGR